MTKIFAAAALALVVVLAACGLNYQEKFAGNVPLKIVNKSPLDVDIFIHKSDGTVLGKQWGDTIKPGGEVTFKIAPGDYKFVAEFDLPFPAPQNVYGSTYIKVAGPMSFVLADGDVATKPGDTLIVAGKNPETEGTRFDQAVDEDQAAEPVAQCLPDGTFTEDSFACCNTSKHAKCEEGYSGCGWVCCSDTSNCATD